MRKYIFDSDLLDDSFIESFKEFLECNDERDKLAQLQGVEKTYEMPQAIFDEFIQYVSECKEFEIAELRGEFDLELKGKTILLVGDYTRWNGTFSAYKVVGSNLKDILNISYSNSDYEFELFAENRQVYSNFADHDGRSLMQFVVVDNKFVDKVTDDFYYNKVTSYTKSKMKSLYPYINSILWQTQKVA